MSYKRRMGYLTQLSTVKNKRKFQRCQFHFSHRQKFTNRSLGVSYILPSVIWFMKISPKCDMKTLPIHTVASQHGISYQ